MADSSSRRSVGCWSVGAVSIDAANASKPGTISLPAAGLPVPASSAVTCAVRLDQLRYEYAAPGNLVGSHDDQVESQPVARHVLQIADQFDQVGWCLIEDDHGSQSTIVERALEVRGPEGIMVGLAEQLS